MKIKRYRTTDGIEFAVSKSKIYFINRTMRLGDNLSLIRFSLKDVRQILEIVEKVQNG